MRIRHVWRTFDEQHAAQTEHSGVIREHSTGVVYSLVKSHFLGE